MNPLIDLLRRPIAHTVLLSCAVNLLLLVPALFMLQVFDRVLASHSTDTLLVLLAGAGIALGLMLVLDHLRTRLQGVAGQLLGDALTPVVTRLAIAQVARRAGPSGQTGASTLRDVATLRTLCATQGLLALADAPWMVVYLLIITLAHPWLGGAATLAALAMVAMAVAHDRFNRRAVEATQAEAGQAARELESGLAQAEVAHALGLGDALVARWQRRQAALHLLQAPANRRLAAFSAFTRGFRQAVQIGMLALGAWLVLRGEATAGVMIATSTLLGRALAPVEQLVGQWRLLTEGRAAWRRLATLLAENPEPEAGRMALPRPTGRLAAQQLVLRVPGTERLILAGVSLALQPGQSLAIVGPSGAGKSSLARLLTGVWAPDAGSVRLDDADLAQWPRAQIGPCIGYLPQDVALFPGTVAENIARLGLVDADAVVRAAQRAQVHELILGLPQGYDTPLEPGSPLVSPGQRQRIALARALYGDPVLLVLDEPNANLDGAGEAALAAALRALAGQVTVVVITHRTALVQQVDQLLVLEAGRVRQLGPTAEVLAAMQPAAAAPARVVELPARAAPARGTRAGSAE